MKRAVIRGAAILLALWPKMSALAAGDDPAVLSTKVVKTSDDGHIVSLDVGHRAAVGVGDRFWIVNGKEVPASGSIYVVSDAACVGRIEAGTDEFAAGSPTVVLRQQGINNRRAYFPPDVTIRGWVSRVPANAESASLSIGRSAGLQPGDGVLISRRSATGAAIPIARGKVNELEDETAQVSLQRLVGNAVTAAGDAAELWPSPEDTRWGRMSSTVLAVKPDEQGAVLTIAGTADDGLVEGRLVDLFHDHQYIGVASLLELSSQPVARARMIKAASLNVPQEGDRAWVRSPSGPPDGPLSAVIFRVEDNYCLIAAGELDGIRREEKMLVKREDPPGGGAWKVIAEITVDKVNVDYSGAYIRQMDVNARTRPWDFAERREVRRPVWKPCGSVKRVDITGRSAFVELEKKDGIHPGQVVELVPEKKKSSAAGIVIHVDGEQCLVYLPPGWGEILSIRRAQVRSATDGGESNTTQPAPASSAGE